MAAKRLKNGHFTHRKKYNRPYRHDDILKLNKLDKLDKLSKFKTHFMETKI